MFPRFLHHYPHEAGQDKTEWKHQHVHELARAGRWLKGSLPHLSPVAPTAAGLPAEWVTGFGLYPAYLPELPPL